ncbi:MAG: VCBS repeat-containing protein [Rubrivivax sp.]|nr:VCBS repeat-containing protein [Rubrivivax sp.]
MLCSRLSISRIGVEWASAVALSLALVTPPCMAQGQDRDVGHCVSGARQTVACWNNAAGKLIPEALENYAEFLPNLKGWDFRVNLPHTRYQPLRNGQGSPVEMVGVVEDASPLYSNPAGLDFADYGHRNNSIWLFRVDAADRQVYASQLPSRVDLSTGVPQNAISLTGGWQKVGLTGGPVAGFIPDRVAVAVSGAGLGAATIHVVVRAAGGGLHHTRRLVEGSAATPWQTPWSYTGVRSLAPPALVSLGAGKVAMAWVNLDKAVNVRVYDAATSQWTQPVVAGQASDVHQPRIMVHGQTLVVMYTSEKRLQHTFSALGSELAFSPPTAVLPGHLVVEGQFDVLVFNGGLHVVARTTGGVPANTRLVYSTTKSPPGTAAQWTAPSFPAVKAADMPRIGNLYENVFVIARTTTGRLAYQRKDPNRPDNRITGGSTDDHWLEAHGVALDAGTAGVFSSLVLLRFNSDLYLTARRANGAERQSVIVNFGRAAMKRLMREKWGMALTHGERGSNSLQFGGDGDVRLVGDFNGDGKTDLVRFTQQAEPGVGPAPTYVRTVRQVSNEVIFSDEELWHSFFSLKGEIPLVGDFNGDGKHDIVTFVQKEQKFADGSPIGPAPVWVSISNGSKFQTSSIWHKFFSLKGEIPLVGDFNGDGKDDIITFVQKEQKFADGSPIGPAPVWVSISNGSKFQTSSIWHKFFSLKGEIPLVGDFNGDGKADIATFVGKAQFDAAGKKIGSAPVWVALSNGTKFGQSRVWHPFFALKGEFPMVADVNMDGKDDIVTFLRGTGAGSRKNNVYVAFSTGLSFERSVLWATDQVNADEIPHPGNFSGRSLGTITNSAADMSRPLRDLYIYRKDGRLNRATAMRTIPYPVGAPWERYRFFTEKGIGIASFPEWIYLEGPENCLTRPFRFGLLGAAGVGGASFMLSSVRPGGGQGHLLEEMGHSLFANCLRDGKDPFGVFDQIYKTGMAAGGLDANNMPGCEPGFDDCRDPEHFFIGLSKRYRIDGDTFRFKVLNGSAESRARRRQQYLWIKENWYKGAEFKRGEQLDVSLFVNGVLCLPGECRIDP